jgi:hypothetical protein
MANMAPFSLSFGMEEYAHALQVNLACTRCLLTIGPVFAKLDTVRAGAQDMRLSQRPVLAESHQRVQRKIFYSCTLSGREDGSARIFSRAALGRASVSQRSSGVAAGRHEVPAKISTLLAVF